VIDRQSGKRPRMSLVSGDMLSRKQNDALFMNFTLIRQTNIMLQGRSSQYDYIVHQDPGPHRI